MSFDVTLVTGASGFVGSAVARALAGRGFEVRALVRPSSDRTNLRGFPVTPVEGDLTDAASLARAVAGCRTLITASGCPIPRRCCAPMSMAPSP
jgi:dihydroflavonol-4-reductase